MKKKILAETALPYGRPRSAVGSHVPFGQEEGGEKTTCKERAKKLLREMTLREKIGQLSLRGLGELDEQGVPKSRDVHGQVARGEVGTIIYICNEGSAEVTRELQRIAVEESRLKIPLLMNVDMIHGLETVFPTPLAAACSFNTALVERAAKAAAMEATTCGANYTNAPMVDLARDPRWGRIAESQGEDPYLAGEMGKAYVRGYQNDERFMMATLKHYAAYGACEGGRDYDTAEVCENTMLNAYLVPFREGVKEGAASVMSAFNAIENVPASGNKKYLRDVLRGKFGFNGIVISDAMSVPEMMAHGYCETPADCAYRALKAGLDIELGTDCYANELEGLIQKGLVREEEIDEAVLRVLEQKFALGLFEDPYKYYGDKSVLCCDEHLALSEELALQSAVLLENDGVLPLKKGTKVAIVGRFAESRELCGCWQYSTKQELTVTVKEGLEAQGFEIVGVSNGYGLTEAEIASYEADVVVFTIGEAAAETDEARSKHSLEFPEEVRRCFDYLKGRNKRVVTLVFALRPRIVNPFKYSNALAYCWHLGQRTGSAIAKLLSGKENFSGKLCVTIPRTEGQLPVYYNRKRGGRPFLPDRQDYRFQIRYDDGENYPQYVFGYGLSYGHFIHGTPVLEKTTMERGEKLTLSLTVKNAGERDGTEIVQLYIRDKVAEVVRPERELKGFQRVFLRAGETKTVEFEISEEMLAYYHSDGEYGADAGEFIAFVGGDSTTRNAIGFSLV